MNTTKIAELLHVDDVEIHHGKLGYAIYVRLGDNRMMSTQSYDDIAKSTDAEKPIHAVAKTLLSLADTLAGRNRPNMDATRAAMQAEAEAVRRIASRPLYEDRGRQIQRYEPAPAYTTPLPPSQEPAVSKSLPSRFHAIVEELSK
jgi:hypothetical protein